MRVNWANKPRETVTSRRKTANEYTVGWICATKTVDMIASSFLDEKYEGYVHLDMINAHFKRYTLGRIEEHNVVITALPDGDEGIQFISVLRDMIRDFPQIRFVLVVLISSDEASQNSEVCLDDLTICTSLEGNGGVMDRDLSVTKQSQSLGRTQLTKQPPRILKEGVIRLREQYKNDKYSIQESINNVFKETPSLRQFQPPDKAHDSTNSFKIISVHGLGENPDYSLDSQNPSRTDKGITRFLSYGPCLKIHVHGLADRSGPHKTKDWEGYAALTAAAYAKDLLNTISWYEVQAEAKIKRYDRNLLSRAAEEGHEAIVQLLLKKGIDSESKNDSGETPLCCAARLGHEAVTNMLLDRGCNAESRDNIGRTPLSLAALMGHLKVMQLLLAKGAADIEAKDNEFGQTPLQHAIKGLSQEVIHPLPRKDADIKAKHNKVDSNREECEAVVSLLLQCGADVGAKDKAGQTALMLAAGRGHTAITRQLIHGHGADTKDKDDNGQTALMMAAAKGHEAVTHLLLEFGADNGAEDKSGQTALMLAAKNGHEKIVQLLRARTPGYKGQS